MFYFLAMESILDYFFLNGKLNDEFFSQNKFVRRFLVTPFFLFPLFMGVYLHYKLNKSLIDKRFVEFENETEIEKEKRK